MSVVPGSRTLFAQLASEHAVKVAAEAGELATLHELCLLHDAVDELDGALVDQRREADRW